MAAIPPTSDLNKASMDKDGFHAWLLNLHGYLTGLLASSGNAVDARAALGLTTGTASGNVPLVGAESATTSVAGLVTKSTPAQNAAGTGTGVVASADLPTAVAALAVPTHSSAASTSGTAIDFTGIPADTDFITICFQSVSTNGSTHFLVKLGDSGGVEDVGYSSSTNYGGSNVTSSAGFVAYNQGAGSGHSGVITLMRSDGNSWNASAVVRPDSGAGTDGALSGTKTLSATLDRVRITTVGGDTFDNGNIAVMAW